MAVRVTPADRHTSVGQHPGMERSIAISRPTVGSERLYSSIVSEEGFVEAASVSPHTSSSAYAVTQTV